MNSDERFGADFLLYETEKTPDELFPSKAYDRTGQFKPFNQTNSQKKLFPLLISCCNNKNRVFELILQNFQGTSTYEYFRYYNPSLLNKTISVKSSVNELLNKIENLIALHQNQEEATLKLNALLLTDDIPSLMELKGLDIHNLDEMKKLNGLLETRRKKAYFTESSNNIHNIPLMNPYIVFAESALTDLRKFPVADKFVVDLSKKHENMERIMKESNKSYYIISEMDYYDYFDHFNQFHRIRDVFAGDELVTIDIDAKEAEILETFVGYLNENELDKAFYLYRDERSLIDQLVKDTLNNSYKFEQYCFPRTLYKEKMSQRTEVFLKLFKEKISCVDIRGFTKVFSKEKNLKTLDELIAFLAFNEKNKDTPNIISKDQTNFRFHSIKEIEENVVFSLNNISERTKTELEKDPLSNLKNWIGKKDFCISQEEHRQKSKEIKNLRKLSGECQVCSKKIPFYLKHLSDVCVEHTDKHELKKILKNIQYYLQNFFKVMFSSSSPLLNQNVKKGSIFIILIIIHILISSTILRTDANSGNEYTGVLFFWLYVGIIALPSCGLWFMWNRKHKVSSKPRNRRIF